MELERPTITRNLVSIIIPVHNRPFMLAECVESVIAQSYRPLEIIIVNDGSSDHGATAGKCEELALRWPKLITCVEQGNSGPGVAREAGRQIAHGEFIAYLDSDDIFYPDKIALQVAALRANPDRDIAYGYVEQCSIGKATDSPRIPWSRSAESIDALYPDILRGRHWCTSCPLYRRELTDRIGAWSTLRYEEDFEYDVRAGCLGARSVHIPKFLVKFRDHADRVSLDFVSPLGFNHQTQARLLICDHIVSSGISLDEPQVQFFAQGLFLSARQLGARGLIDEAEGSLDGARRILRCKKGGDYKSFIYASVAGVFGHNLLGRIASYYDSLRAFLPWSPRNRAINHAQ